MSGNGTILELDDVRFSYRVRKGLFRHVSYPAVRGVSFDVRRGESLGIIGRNGCGKSTLLKVIAGIFRPDAGAIRRHCSRISLLSLSLGFDPELTGVENGVIAGMLLGASRARVNEELEEIIAFSELGQAIHDPIKTYSTGMRARLGFSVALKLKAELMLVDEVMGVGDAKFREKAEEAMRERISSDQTVIMVSHSLKQTKKLSDRVVWIDEGRVRGQGAPADVIDEYQEALELADRL